MATRADAIAEALFQALIDAPDADVDGLAAAVEAFKTETYRSYNSVMRQPFASKLLGAIDEAVAYRRQARPEEVK